MRLTGTLAVFLLGALAAHGAWAEADRRELNDGMLVLEDVPEIPRDIVEQLIRFRNMRSARFLQWDAPGDGIYVSTRFGEVSQIHGVYMPGGS